MAEPESESGDLSNPSKELEGDLGANDVGVDLDSNCFSSPPECKYEQMTNKHHQ